MLTPQQQHALADLKQMLEQLEDLSTQVGDVIRQHFPQESSRCEAYGVTNFGWSNNQYDTTLASLIEELESEA